jgi:hypothetical protein
MCDSDERDMCNKCLLFPCEIIDPKEANIAKIKWKNPGGANNLKNIFGWDRYVIGVYVSETKLKFGQKYLPMKSPSP